MNDFDKAYEASQQRAEQFNLERDSDYRHALMAMGAAQMEKDRQRIQVLEARIAKVIKYCEEQTDGDSPFDSTLAWLAAILEGRV